MTSSLILDPLNRMLMAVPRKFVSRLIIFSDKGYFEIVLFSTSISIGYHASTLHFLACVAN